MNWTPDLRGNKRALTWVWNGFECRPTEDTFLARYRVFYKGEELTSEPICLMRARRLAESRRA